MAYFAVKIALIRVFRGIYPKIEAMDNMVSMDSDKSRPRVICYVVKKPLFYED